MAEERKIIRKKAVTVTVPVLHVPKSLQGFVDFIREQGVVGLAVGFVLGVAAKAVVDSIVNNLINPIVGLYGRGGELASKYWCMKQVAGQCSNKFGYGAVLNQLISFMIVAGVVYFVIKGLKLDKLDRKKEP
ncbi:MAG: mscL [Candidatus Saccharibacteria bacterium]|nr:mscL [Candidatus Saccharibacteria bacterium]